MVRRFPEWMVRPWPGGAGVSETDAVLRRLRAGTVCQSARCPNLGECWARHTVTFLLLGRECTRRCGFCAVSKGVPDAPDPDEPFRVAEAAAELNLGHVVLTSVTRDDLADGGAGHFADTVRAVRERCPSATVEVLTPDFGGDVACVETVAASGPDVYGHNIETVARLYAGLRGCAEGYGRALTVLRAVKAAAPAMALKSGLMLGLGEDRQEVCATLRDLFEAGCDAVYIGQYLQAAADRVAVTRYVSPDEFAWYECEAYRIGFRFVMAGPFVRSSYRSESLVRALELRRGHVYRKEASNAI